MQTFKEDDYAPGGEEEYALRSNWLPL